MTTDALAGDRRAAELLAALARPEGRADPYPLYDRLRALGPGHVFGPVAGILA